LTETGFRDGFLAAVENMVVDHGGIDIFVSQEILDGANIIARFEKMGGEAVAEGVRANRFDTPSTCSKARKRLQFTRGRSIPHTVLKHSFGLNFQIVECQLEEVTI
jgi:hypothetical protein